MSITKNVYTVYRKSRYAGLAIIMLLFAVVVVIQWDAYAQNAGETKDQSNGTGKTKQPVAEPFPHYQQGLEFLKTGKFEQAIEAFEQALANNENPLDSHFKLGTLYHFVKNDRQKSQYHLERYMELLATVNDEGELDALAGPDQDDGAYKKAQLLFQQALVSANNGDLIAARQHLQQAVAEYPYDPVMLYNLGVINHKLNDLDAAVEQYKKAIEINPNNEAGFYALGIAYQQKGDNLAAIDMYKKVLSFNPKNVAVLNNTAILLEQVGMYDDAIERYRQIIAIDPKYVRAYNNLGTIYARRDNVQKAQDYFKQAIDIDPFYLEPHFNLGMLYEQQGQAEQALEEYRLVFLRNADFPGIEEKIKEIETAFPGKQVLMGVSEETEQKSDKQAVVVEKAAEETEGDSVNRTGAARSSEPMRDFKPVAQKQDNEQEAQIELRKHKVKELIEIVRDNPDSVQAYMELVDYLVSIEKYDEAFQYAELGKERFPDSAKIHMMVADIAAQRNFFYRATKEYEAILEKYPDRIDAHYKLSLIYVDKRNPLRDSQTALKHYRTFIDAGGKVPANE